MSNQKNTLEIAISAAKEAGQILMKYYAETIEIQLKNDHYDVGSIVTKADLESEEKIISILKESFPDHGIYGEESEGFNMEADYVWYIDPLDGTSNFTRHIPLFGISIGLIYKGESVLGVLYFPALDLLVSAEKDKGCTVNGLATKVSERPMIQSLYYSGGKFKGNPQIETRISDRCGLVKIIDSSSYEFAQIAMGDAEIYYLVNSPHDVVAGVCIVQEAGGLVTDAQGNPWRLDSDMILVTNGLVHQEIVDSLQNK